MTEEKIKAVRNAIFEAARNKPLEDVMLGIIMAQATLVVATCEGDEAKSKRIIEHYHSILMESLHVYCLERGPGPVTLQ